MPEPYAEIEAHIEQALHKLPACENPNIAAVASSRALDKTDANQHRTSWKPLEG